ncbi:ATP-binding cassette domain-containing protein [Metamycoplasma hyosynoviae]|uniref:ATP-binding cassette domain-containing protein n=1 Tax=Metamycoplasma hyosynoviae TaxID=29559 RepID=UPI0023595F2A|nr:ATP-binding cassette domain-containing protein [Metamycoplasma hyosynoviae]MDC8927065.1 ATP-binding cassette domain-containing protein [Metamycoplasma hyosynoviae]
MDIKLQNLTASYRNNKKVNIINNVSFSISSGQKIAIIGKSGAGKTSIFNAIINQLFVSEGSVYIDDKKINELSHKEMKKFLKSIGFLSQETFLLDFENVYESILRTYTKYKNFFYDFFYILTKSQKQEIYETLESLGLFDKAFTRIDQLSGGQKQRVEIAKLLLKDIKLILADEPTTSLDIKTSNDVLSLIKELSQNKNITVIANIHDIELAKKYFDKIIGLKKGEVLFYKVPSDITSEDIEKLYN